MPAQAGTFGVDGSGTRVDRPRGFLDSAATRNHPVRTWRIVQYIATGHASGFFVSIDAVVERFERPGISELLPTGPAPAGQCQPSSSICDASRRSRFAWSIMALCAS